MRRTIEISMDAPKTKWDKLYKDYEEHELEQHRAKLERQIKGEPEPPPQPPTPFMGSIWSHMLRAIDPESED